jgi:Xaa-Pro aminopeptidase
MTDTAARRARLAAQMQAGAVAVLPTAPAAIRNGDAEYPYRHDSHFYYLSGFSEPESVLVLVAAQADGNAPTRAILFCRDKHPEREIWDGFRYGPEAARAAFGFDEAYPIDELDARMPGLLGNAPALYYALAANPALDARVQGWMKDVRAKSRSGITAPATFHDLLPLIDEMRLVKDAH